MKGILKAKPSVARKLTVPKSQSNTDLQEKINAAQSKAAIAQAKVNLVRAQIEVKGKAVVYDYKDGRESLKVVDRKL